MKLMKHLSIFVTAAAALGLFASCGLGPGRYGAEKSKSGVPLVWQTAWVDPHIVTSDTVLTLFQAGRVDSVQVERTRAVTNNGGAVKFQIQDITCDVEINLLDSQFRLVRHLMSRTLPGGYYKLTLNPGIAKRMLIVPGQYQVSIRYCRKGVTGAVSVS